VHLGEAGEHQVADRVAGEDAAAAEAVLQQPGHLLGARLLAGQRGERHPQVTGGQHRHLPPDPAG
jgi:hypothetical protein